jgi:hypothetical protein
MTAHKTNDSCLAWSGASTVGHSFRDGLHKFYPIAALSSNWVKNYDLPNQWRLLRFVEGQQLQLKFQKHLVNELDGIVTRIDATAR